MMKSTDWLLVGAGALGSLFAAELRRINIPLKTIAYGSDDGERVFHPYQSQLPENLSLELIPATEIDVISTVLICVKSHHVNQALASIAHALTQSSVVLVLQNGMPDVVSYNKAINGANLIIGSTTQAALKQGKLIHHTGQGMTYWGFIQPQSITTPIVEVITTLHRALPDCCWTNNIESIIWRKLAINAIVNPLTAFYQCKNGELLDNCRYKNHMNELIHELAPVLLPKLGMQQITELADLITQVVNNTQANFSSMHQDFYYQRPSELNAISGLLIEYSKSEGATLPQYRSLYDELSLRESRHDKQH